MYGQDILYIPRVSIEQDEIFNEDYSRFDDAYTIEMYIANTEGFEGEGTLLSKFGLEIRDQATFVVSKRRFQQLVDLDENDVSAIRPQEGDLIYLPLTNSLFEIKFVEHEKPFYRLSNLPTFEVQCELFEYSSEELDTGIRGIDQYETEFATRTVLEIEGGERGFYEGENIHQLIQTEAIATAKVLAVIDINTGSVEDTEILEPGFGYESAPIVEFPLPRSGIRAEGYAIIDTEGVVTDIIVTNPGLGYVGDVAFDLEKSPEPSRERIVISGEVARFDETRKAEEYIGFENVTRVANLQLVGVKASGGEVHEFMPESGNIIRDDDDSDSGWTILKVYELGDSEDLYIPDNQDAYADNTQYEIDSGSIIDFSEINPFGDPRVKDNN